MPKFISVLKTELSNPIEWVFAQESETLSGLEMQQTFDGISRIKKATETYRVVNNAARTISGNATGGTINVISHERVNEKFLSGIANSEVKKNKDRNKKRIRKPSKKTN